MSGQSRESHPIRSWENGKELIVWHLAEYQTYITSSNFYSNLVKQILFWCYRQRNWGPERSVMKELCVYEILLSFSTSVLFQLLAKSNLTSRTKLRWLKKRFPRSLVLLLNFWGRALTAFVLGYFRKDACNIVSPSGKGQICFLTSIMR